MLSEHREWRDAALLSGRAQGEEQRDQSKGFRAKYESN